MQPLWKTVWRFSKKFKKELPYDPAIPLLGIYLKKIKIVIQKDICTLCSLRLYTIAKIWKQPKNPSIHTHTHTHTHTVKYYSAIEKNRILPFATTWMNLEGIMLSELSQTERQILHGITYMWNPKVQQTSEYNKKEADL